MNWGYKVRWATPPSWSPPIILLVPVPLGAALPLWWRQFMVCYFFPLTAEFGPGLPWALAGWRSSLPLVFSSALFALGGLPAAKDLMQVSFLPWFRLWWVGVRDRIIPEPGHFRNQATLCISALGSGRQPDHLGCTRFLRLCRWLSPQLMQHWTKIRPRSHPGLLSLACPSPHMRSGVRRTATKANPSRRERSGQGSCLL